MLNSTNNYIKDFKMKLNYTHIGQTIKSYRKNKHITQKELSKLINKSVTHISKIEQGQSKASLQTIVDIANTLEITVDEILKGSIIKTAQKEMIKEYEEIFKNCSFAEQKFLIENLKFAKYQLKELNNTK